MGQGHDRPCRQRAPAHRWGTQANEGSLTLSFNGSTTEPIPSYSLYTYGIQAALAALPSIGEGNVEVTGEGKAANPYVVTFKGALGGADQPLITADTSQLNGPVDISTIVNGTSTTADTGTGFEVCTVAAECRAGTASGENGALSNPQSVAVDQDTGNVYVSDRGNRRVDEYDGEGNFIRAFGFDVAESGPGDTGTAYEVCNEEDGDTCKEGVAGSGVGQFGEGFAERGFGIAVSPAIPTPPVARFTRRLRQPAHRHLRPRRLQPRLLRLLGQLRRRTAAQRRSGLARHRLRLGLGRRRRHPALRLQKRRRWRCGFLAPMVPPSNEQQEITFTGFSTGDNFTLTCPDGTSTEELIYVATSTKIIKEGLEKACGANNVLVEGDPPSITVTFQGALGGTNQPQMTCTALGGGAGSCAVTTTSEGHSRPLQAANNASSATRGLAVNPAGSVSTYCVCPAKEARSSFSNSARHTNPA